MHSLTYDFIVVGAGSAGCIAAAGLVERGAGSVLVLEAGPSDRWPLVRIPFALIWMIGSKSRDWRYRSAPMSGLGGRTLDIPRGRMIGGSGSINSMVWFRGCRTDFDAWDVPGWGWSDVEPAFEAVEVRLTPTRLATPHPVTEALASIFGDGPVTPESESAGVWRYNMRTGRRWSAADAFLRPAGCQVLQNTQVQRLTLKGDHISGVELTDGTHLSARKGVVLAAGAIGSPEILLNSGIGPADDLRAAGIEPVLDVPELGENLHDHPGCGIHYSGPNSGYGLNLRDAPGWLSGPARWLLTGKGVLASPTVEGGMFFNSQNAGGKPDIQSHFMPFLIGWDGRRYIPGSGYFADAVVCRPKSRGRLSLTRNGLSIDLGLFNDPSDLDLLTRGFLRLRTLMDQADNGPPQSVRGVPRPRRHLRRRGARPPHRPRRHRLSPGRHPAHGRRQKRPRHAPPEVSGYRPALDRRRQHHAEDHQRQHQRACDDDRSSRGVT